MTRRPDFLIWMLASLAALAIGSARECYAVAPSPRRIEAVQGTPNETGERRAAALYEAARAAGVDRIYKQFALDLSTMPQGATGHRSVLVVLCDFNADVYGPAWHPAPASTPAYYDSLFFSDDPADGITSLREYYRDNSHGRLIVSGRVTPGWLTMPHSYAYYVNGQAGLDFGAYPRSAQKLAEDAMTAAYATLGSDLTFFDNDGPDGIPHSADDDGYIDAVCVIHPGVGAEVVAYPGSYDNMWSHEAGIAVFSDCSVGAPNSGCLPGMMLGDVRGFLYLMVAEYYDAPGDRAVGTYFHEFGHTIGLADLYALDWWGLGLYSLMAYGNYLPLDIGQGALASHPANLDAWSRQFIGLETPVVPAGPGSQVMAPVGQGGGSLKVWTNGQPGSEYFLMENRAQAGADLFLPGAGLLVYHVNDTQVDNLGSVDNARVAVVQADGRDDLGMLPGNYGDAGDFFPGSTLNRTWNESSLPNSRDHSGQDTQVRMSNVARSSTATISFDLSVSTRPALQVASYYIGDGSNGFADANEQDSLFVSIRNVGIPSGPITYTLTTGDPYIQIPTGSSSSPMAATGAIVGLATPFILDVGAPPVIPHVAAFTLAWTDGATSGTTAFSLSVGMRAGISEGFESGAPGWTHEPLPPSSADDWHASSSRAHSGAVSMKVGSRNALGEGSNIAQSYTSMEDAALVSPMFQLASGSTLTFQSWIDAETYGGTTAWDGGRVEIALNGGSWRPLVPADGYGYVIEHRSSAALRGEEALSGSPQRWRRVVIDLSGYEGAAQVRFRFSSDELNGPLYPSGDQVRYYEGWYVDDVAVSRELAASIDLDPNTINLGSHAPRMTVYIEATQFDPTSVAIPTVRLAGSVAPVPKLAVVSDHNGNGIPDLMLRFSRELLDPLLVPGVNALELTGSLTTGESFIGVDEVRVINPPGHLATASVAPNPLNPGGVLTLRTVEQGLVSARLFDLHGRLVRTFLAPQVLPSGLHEVRIDGRGQQGEALASGVYLYRVETNQGVIAGRVVILK